MSFTTNNRHATSDAQDRHQTIVLYSVIWCHVTASACASPRPAVPTTGERAGADVKRDGHKHDTVVRGGSHVPPAGHTVVERAAAARRAVHVGRRRTSGHGPGMFMFACLSTAAGDLWTGWGLCHACGGASRATSANLMPLSTFLSGANWQELRLT